MTIPDPDREGTPDDPDAMPPISDEIWLRFLTDDERAIRESALEEPSARERARARHPSRPDTGPAGRCSQPPVHAPADDGVEAVGDLWHPDDPQPTWRELDGRGRFRRFGRLIATAAAIAVALGAWSWLSTTAGTPRTEPGGGTVQELETAPKAVPTPSPAPPGTFEGSLQQ
ncbi:hypothetical protein ABTX62_06370 [Streptomyces sp. NPDC096046]|uniref:hypothetical protein n=1 Tax=Streptomyces sp. NPDC096046 TaxID=3155542 RepID=UPI003324381B